MTKEEKVFNLLYENKLAWEVTKRDLVALPTEDEVHPMDNEPMANLLYTESFGMFRNDTKKWLGTVGKIYEPYQNHEMASTILDAAEGLELDVTRGGELKNGALVYLQIGLTDETIGNSGLKRYITCLNSHNGSSSIGFGSTNTVVVCQNTFYKAYNGISRIRHTSNAKERVQHAMEEIKRSIGNDEALMTDFKRMADTKLEDEILQKVIAACFKADLDKDKPSTRKVNQLSTVANDIATDVKIHGNNLWALFNGITRYTNHHDSVKADKKEESIMSGSGYKKNLIAFDEIMDWIGERTAPSKLVLGKYNL